MAPERNPPLLRLDRFLTWVIPVLLGFALVYGGMGIQYADLPSQLAAGVIALVAVMLVFARWEVRHAHMTSAVAIVASSFYGAIIIITLLQPALGYSNAIVPLIIALIIFLYAPELHAMFTLACAGLVTALVIILSVVSPVQSMLPQTLLLALRSGALIGNVLFAFILVHQIRQQLILALRETVAAHSALADAHARLHEQAQRDALTGLLQRGLLDDICSNAFDYAAATHTSVGIVMLDLDHFKQINDTFGHAAGDMVLRSFGNLLQTTMRTSDWACRYGGEEFVLIVPTIELNVLVHRVEHVRRSIHALHLEHHGKRIGPLSVSAGIALYPDHGMTAAQVLQAADRALYQAKQAGRNCVWVDGMLMQHEHIASLH